MRDAPVIILHDEALLFLPSSLHLAARQISSNLATTARNRA
jgi:DNA helicase HerA-like ATPase